MTQLRTEVFDFDGSCTLALFLLEGSYNGPQLFLGMLCCHYLSQERIEWVPQFVRDHGICHCEQLLLRLHVQVLYLVRHVDNLDEYFGSRNPPSLFLRAEEVLLYLDILDLFVFAKAEILDLEQLILQVEGGLVHDIRQAHSFADLVFALLVVVLAHLVQLEHFQVHQLAFD